ncbi:hypothetical protein [Salinibaculum rarum]|uniref:hypothetical protein n=1 Tax=Salinibaculum rarum TaxID=3058903 RepID=UPI00265E845D|nr:hypothetical protein [Salinibaculum sp. KK48]
MTDDERAVLGRDGRHAQTVVVGVGVAAVVIILGVALVGGLNTSVLGLGAEETQTTVVDVWGDTTVTVTYTTETGETRGFVVDGVSSELSDSDNGWAFIDRSALPPALEEGENVDSDSVVPVGDRVLVGNTTSSTRQVGEATVRVVVPASRDVDPVRKAHFISEFLSPYALNSDQRAVTLVAAPDALPYSGLSYADGTGYVTIEAFWDGNVGSVWLHEFFHARQTFTLESEMTWFREASAEYLTYRAMQEQYGPVTDRDIRARLDGVPDYHDVALASPSTWDNESVDYTKGARLLYAIDASVRTGSNGEHTLFDVFRAINEREGPVSVSEFTAVVEAHSGTNESWIRDAIETTGPIDRYRESQGIFRNG